VLLDNKTTVFIRCKKPMREKKGVVGATFSRPLAADCRPYVIHAIALFRLTRINGPASPLVILTGSTFWTLLS
jgi:hypothetical protein